jgi:hypothetical protein
MTMIIPPTRLKQHSSRTRRLGPSMSIAGHYNSTPPFTPSLPNAKHYGPPYRAGCPYPASAGLRSTVYAYASVVPTATDDLIKNAI